MTIEKVYDELYGMIEDLKKQIAAAGGSGVTITPALESGTKVADYTIGSDEGVLYAPTIPNIYSGDEVVVGNDGIDDVYCKCVHIAALPSTTNSDVAYPHGISNIKRVLKWDAYAHLSSGICAKINAFVTSEQGSFSAASTMTANVNNINISIRVGSDRSTASGLFYIYYTKTVETKKPRKK